MYAGKPHFESDQGPSIYCLQLYMYAGEPHSESDQATFILSSVIYASIRTTLGHLYCIQL